MKKKLMLISPMLHQGGFERVCVTTARLLAPYFDVTIVIFDSTNIAYDVTGLHIIDIKMGVKKGKWRKLMQLIKRSRRVRQLKARMQPDIAYSFGPTANMVNALSKVRGTKTWLGLRNYTDIEETVQIRWFIRRADLMVCCSKVIEEVLKKKFGFHNTVTLYNLYDVDTIRAQAAEGEPKLPWPEAEGKYLISMGRDDDQKGFWHMLKIFACVHRQRPEARLIILGAGTFVQYKKLAAGLGIADAVYFAGMRKDPYCYLKKASIYLLTSLNEGFPNALVEGMALGLAAVAADCMTGPREILLADCQQDNMAAGKQSIDQRDGVIWGEYGVLLPAMSGVKNLNGDEISQEEEIFAQAVIQLLQDEDLLQQYQQAALKRAGNFTYESYIEQFLQLAKQG